MITSQTTKELFTALVGFHADAEKVSKDAKNPFFKSSYASLSNILAGIKEPLVRNGLVITQFPEGQFGLTTRLCHKSGEWMESTFEMKPVKEDPQSRGSAITYARRYAIGAILSLNIDDDDDGNHASHQTNGYQKQEEPKDEKPWLNENTEAFTKALLSVKDGTVTIDQIEKKYKLSKAVKGILEASKK